MENCLKFYIDGAWVEPSDPKPFDVINPANEQVIGQIMLGNENDVNKAVAAAKKAFLSFSRSSVQERLELWTLSSGPIKIVLMRLLKPSPVRWAHRYGCRRRHRPLWASPICQPRAAFWKTMNSKKNKTAR